MRFRIARIWRRGIPLRYCIAALVVVAVVVLTSLNLFNIYKNLGKSSRDLARQHFALLVDEIRTAVEFQVQPILSLVRGTSFFVRDTSLRSYQQARQTYRLSCIQALLSHQNILAINFGFHDGSFFSVTDLREAKLRQRYGAPDNAAFGIWAIAPGEDGELLEWWEFLAADKGSISLRTAPVQYDPRKPSTSALSLMWQTMCRIRCGATRPVCVRYCSTCSTMPSSSPPWAA